jgi:hypothetical protein
MLERRRLSLGPRRIGPVEEELEARAPAYLA